MPFVEKLLYNNEVWEAGWVTYLGQKMGPSRSQWNWTEIAASRRVDPPARRGSQETKTDNDRHFGDGGAAATRSFLPSRSL